MKKKPKTKKTKVKKQAKEIVIEFDYTFADLFKSGLKSDLKLLKYRQINPKCELTVVQNEKGQNFVEIVTHAGEVLLKEETIKKIIEEFNTTDRRVM